MYRGFNLKFNLEKDSDYKVPEMVGQVLYQQNLKEGQALFDYFVNNDNSLDGSAIQNYWFPQVKTDIFISYSGKDKDAAIILSGWLWHKFRLKAFIDSCLWGYATELQRRIDNEHCFIPSRGFYSYELRNHATSRVHMMLSTALSMMIDKTECLFFLNTPNSIKSYGELDKTESPWIYSEMAISQIVRRKEPKRRFVESISGFDGGDDIEKALKMTYNLDLEHLTNLDANSLKLWQKSNSLEEHSLDTLYRLFPLKPTNKQLLK